MRVLARAPALDLVQHAAPEVRPVQLAHEGRAVGGGGFDLHAARVAARVRGLVQQAPVADGVGLLLHPQPPQR